MILVTTAYSPSNRTRSFVKDLIAILPNSKSVSRGKLNLALLGAVAAEEGAEKVVIVKEKNGNPEALEVYEVKEAELVPLGTVRLKGVTLAREKGKRLYNVKRVCLRGYNLLPDVLDLVKKVSFLLNIPLAESPEEAKDCDLIMDIEPKGNLYEVVFRVPGSPQPVGPSWRLRGVEVRGEDKVGGPVEGGYTEGTEAGDREPSSGEE